MRWGWKSWVKWSGYIVLVNVQQINGKLFSHTKKSESNCQYTLWRRVNDLRVMLKIHGCQVDTRDIRPKEACCTHFLHNIDDGYEEIHKSLWEAKKEPFKKEVTSLLLKDFLKEFSWVFRVEVNSMEQSTIRDNQTVSSLNYLML